MAVLYCFLNGEVKAEVSRTLRGIKWTHGIRWGPRPSTHSVSTCSCNNVSKSGSRRHSKRSRWWKSRWKAPSCFFQDRAIRRSTHSMASTQGVPLNPTKCRVFPCVSFLPWCFGFDQILINLIGVIANELIKSSKIHDLDLTVLSVYIIIKKLCLRK